MWCKKNGGLMAVMIAILVCIISANNSHGSTSMDDDATHSPAAVCSDEK